MSFTSKYIYILIECRENDYVYYYTFCTHLQPLSKFVYIVDVAQNSYIQQTHKLTHTSHIILSEQTTRPKK